MKRKGFTLIELLAVIVILAIIALIAMPLVLNTIEKAREGAAKASAYAYAEEVERYIILSEIDPTLPKLQTGVEYKLSKEKNEVAALADPATTYINDLVSIKGDKPTSGYLKLDGQYKIEKMEMVIKSYPVTCENDKCEVTGSKVEEEKKEEPEISYPSILEKAKTLVYDENGTCKNDDTTYTYMGGCYIKGASNNNYVWYNGFMWRIMGINSDNTVRLITDDAVTALSYGPANAGLTYKTNTGYIHNWLNEYFYNNLNSTKSIIQSGSYFCNEATTSGTARETCSSGNEVSTKIGIISFDEYLLAGNSSSYLHTIQTIWTMTPYNESLVWRIDNDGNVYGTDTTYLLGIRPVINVASNSSITSGEGTSQSFYVLEEKKENNVTGKLSEKVTSGEYVTLEGHTYRVLRKTTDGVKLFLDEYYEESEGTTYTMEYNETTKNNIFTLDSGIGKKLNENVLAWLGLSTSDKIVTTTYYQGDGIGYGATYNDALKQSNGVEAKVGLMQIGDILTSQSSTILTKNYTTASDYNNARLYWLINKHKDENGNDSYFTWCVITNSNVGSAGIENTLALRPVITVRNDLDITSGTGTWKNPYQI